jgi:hypothetical protein
MSGKSKDAEILEKYACNRRNAASGPRDCGKYGFLDI